MLLCPTLPPPALAGWLQGALEEEWRQHASLAASLQDMVAGAQTSGDAERQLRLQLVELAERVAVLTAAQVGWGGDV